MTEDATTLTVLRAIKRSYANYVTFLGLTRSSGSTLSAADIDRVLSTNLSTILADVF